MSAPRAQAAGRAEGKSEEAFRTIGEVSRSLDLPQHVLRFWETRFSQLRPLKRGGNRRYYRPEDVELLRAIRTLLYDEGYTIKGVQKRFREQGVKSTVTAVLDDRTAPRATSGPAPSQGRAASSSPPDTGEAAAQAGRGSGGEAAPLDLDALLAELKALRRLLD